MGNPNCASVAAEDANQSTNTGGDKGSNEDCPAESLPDSASGNMVKTGQDQTDCRSYSMVGGNAHMKNIAWKWEDDQAEQPQH